MILEIFLLIIGLVIIVKGADIFVDGISSIARHLKVSTFVIALTVVAFGTSAPELAISFSGILNGSDDLVLANVVGSSIVNILLVLGIAAIIHPIKVKSSTVKKEIPMVLLMYTTLVVLFMDNLFDQSITNILSRTDGIILMLFFTVFVYYLFSIMRNIKMSEDGPIEEKPKFDKKWSVIYSILGLGMIIIGSELTVDNAVILAEGLNVSEKIISMTVITIGTSLPEIIMSAIAVKKNEYDFTLGNIIGTNIFNIGIVLGLPLVVCGNVISFAFTGNDMIVMLISALLLFLFAGSDRIISKKEGIMLLIMFIAYYTYLFLE